MQSDYAHPPCPPPAMVRLIFSNEFSANCDSTIVSVATTLARVSTCPSGLQLRISWWRITTRSPSRWKRRSSRTHGDDRERVLRRLRQATPLAWRRDEEGRTLCLIDHIHVGIDLVSSLEAVRRPLPAFSERARRAHFANGFTTLAASCCSLSYLHRLR